MAYTTQQIELSMNSTADPSQKLKAYVYTMDGVTDEQGNTRLMSIGQLVMAICLQRAAALEDEIIDLMRSVELNTYRLEALTKIESSLVEYHSNNQSFDTRGNWNLTVMGQTYTYDQYLNDVCGLDFVNQYGTVWDPTELAAIITKIEEQMDSLNTISQETLIDLQSRTTKRDQTYDMVSNIEKSLYNQMMGNINNI